MLLFSTTLNINDSMTKEKFIELVIEWNNENPHEYNTIPNIEWKGEMNISYSHKNLSLDIEEYRNENIIAVRYEKKEDNGVIWYTDYIMNFKLGKMAIKLDRSYTEDADNKDSKFSTPHFITLLIDKGYVANDNNLPVTREPIYIDENNITIITDIINGNTQYHLPIVYVSRTADNIEPVDIKNLARTLKGTAHVLVLQNYNLNNEIERTTDNRAESDGAIGIYFPNSPTNHKKYLYHSVDGQDYFLREKVSRDVLLYCSSQMVDSLFTWRGVNYAILLDKSTANKEKRIAAEEAQKIAESEREEYVKTFDIKNEELSNQVAQLTKENIRLSMENQRLKNKIDSEDTPVLYMGQESEFYPGEIKDILLSVLSDNLSSLSERKRRADVVKDIIDSNNYEHLGEKKAEEIKRILTEYRNMDDEIIKPLEKEGFEMTHEGKHYKAKYYRDGRYSATLSCTPSDKNAGKAAARELIKVAL